jgi:hypothetical protein
VAEIFIDSGEAVRLADVLLALARLLSWLVVVALCALVVAFVYALLWPLNKLVSTLSGGIVATVPGSTEVEHAVTAALGSAVSSFDKQVGAFWHGLKTLVVNVAEELFGLAVLSEYLYWWAGNKLVNIIWHRFSSFVHQGVKQAEALARTAEKDASRAYSYARSEAHTLERDIHRIDAVIEHTLAPEIKTARELAREAEDLANKAWKAISGSAVGVTAAAVTGVLAIALSNIGLGWLQCPSNPFTNSKRPCGLWADLAKFLPLLGFLALSFDFPEFVSAAETVAGGIGDAVAGIEGTFALELPQLPPPGT